MVASRGQLSKDMEKEVAAYVAANPDDKEFRSLTTVQKHLKLYDRSAEDLSLKLKKFSEEVDLDKQKSPSTRNTKRRNFKRVMDRNKDRLLQEQQEQARVASAAAARFLHPAAAAAFPHQHFHHMTPLSVTPHLHPHQHGPHHCSTPMFQPITQVPATAASAQGVGESLLAPINLFNAPTFQSQAASQAASQAKSDVIVEKLTENSLQLTKSLDVERDKVDKLAELVIEERAARLKVENQVEQQGNSILQNQRDIHQLQMTQAKGAIDTQELQKKVDEEAADKEVLKNDVNEMKSMMAEVLTLTSQKRKKRVAFAPANVEHPIPAREPEKKKEPETPKKKHESNPPTSNTPLRRSKRISASMSGM